jgi:hypothetical protein
VLPFANIGGDPEQEHFVDGVTESLTTDLSRMRGAFVTGRNTAFTYKGKAVDLKQIGRELNVRYALEGSVQRGGNRMRVNVHEPSQTLKIKVHRVGVRSPFRAPRLSGGELGVERARYSSSTPKRAIISGPSAVRQARARSLRHAGRNRRVPSVANPGRE